MHKLSRGDGMKQRGSVPYAVAQIRGGQDAPNLSGQVKFYQQPEWVLVVAQITGLPRNSTTGFFALHIHEGGSCLGQGFSETGGHYNPDRVEHPKHAGDLPPLLICQGGAFLAVKTDRFRVPEIIGRTVVIHSGADDFHTQPAGNAGTKIACGVIQRSTGHGICHAGRI